MEAMQVRAFYRAARVASAEPPYDNLAMKVYYPCLYSGSLEERNTGFIPADEGQAPFPVVIIMPGINISHESYSWLAHNLARAGLVTLSYSWIGREMEDRISVTPGVELAGLTAAEYGKQATCPALPVLLDELQSINRNSLLAGLLDLENVFLGGHSAGGTMALLNGNRNWFPQLRGVFTYAAHCAANKLLGWPENSMMPLEANIPLLLMGGSRDGVIEASGFRYSDGTEAGPTTRIQRTFDESIEGGRDDCHLLIVEGANHFSFSHPADTATGRPFLDHPETQSGEAIRAYLAELISSFCHSALERESATATLNTLCNPDHPLAAIAGTK